MLPVVFSDSASMTLCEERRSISTRHAGGYRGGLLPGRMGLLCVFTAVNRDVFGAISDSEGRFLIICSS